MFENAIKKSLDFIGHLKTVSRIYPGNDLIIGGATFIIINDEGWVITCKHVASQIGKMKSINSLHQQIQKEIRENPTTPEQDIYSKHGVTQGKVVEIVMQITNMKSVTSYTIIDHPTEDISLIKFNLRTPLSKRNYPVFSQTDSIQGKFLCRIGFPFNEFSNFVFNQDEKMIKWTQNGVVNSRYFPLEGMHVRNIPDVDGGLTRFEISNPNIKGQSGGPVFDQYCTVYGMCTEIKSLDLQVPHLMYNPLTNTFSSHLPHQNLPIGVCIHSRVMIDFMKANSVNYSSI